MPKQRKPVFVCSSLRRCRRRSWNDKRKACTFELQKNGVLCWEREKKTNQMRFPCARLDWIFLLLFFCIKNVTRDTCNAMCNM